MPHLYTNENYKCVFQSMLSRYQVTPIKNPLQQQRVNCFSYKYLLQPAIAGLKMVCSVISFLSLPLLPASTRAMQQWLSGSLPAVLFW